MQQIYQIVRIVLPLVGITYLFILTTNSTSPLIKTLFKAVTILLFTTWFFLRFIWGFKGKKIHNDADINVQDAYEIFKDFNLTSRVTSKKWEKAIKDLIFLRRDFEYLKKGETESLEKGKADEKEYKKIMLDLVLDLDRGDLSSIIWDFLKKNELAFSYNEKYQPEDVLNDLQHFYPNLVFSIKSTFNEKEWTWTLEGKINDTEIKNLVVSWDKPIGIFRKIQQIIDKNDNLKFKFAQTRPEDLLIYLVAVPRENFKKIINNRYLFI